MKTRVDVAIIGGGPAGLATALHLSSKGITAVIVNRRKVKAPFAETLPPQIKPELERLGLRSSEIERVAIPSFGISANWGGRNQFRSHVFDVHGSGWHVAQGCIPALLTKVSVERGIQLIDGQFLSGRRHTDRWDVTLRVGVQTRTLEARLLVDATGRGASVARRVSGAKLSRFDKLCCIAAMMRSMDDDQTVRVSAAPYGWWYASPVAPGWVTVSLMSDTDLLRNIGARLHNRWFDLLQTAGLLRTWGLDSADGQDFELRMVPCETSMLDPIVGQGWMAVGDAATVFDPLASAGVIKAINTGRLAAETIAESLQRPSRGALTQYAAHLTNAFDRFNVAKREHYALQTRWKGEPFWTRRCAEKGPAIGMHAAS